MLHTNLVNQVWQILQTPIEDVKNIKSNFNVSVTPAEIYAVIQHHFIKNGKLSLPTIVDAIVLYDLFVFYVKEKKRKDLATTVLTLIGYDPEFSFKLEDIKNEIIKLDDVTFISTKDKKRPLHAQITYKGEILRTHYGRNVTCLTKPTKLDTTAGYFGKFKLDNPTQTNSDQQKKLQKRRRSNPNQGVLKKVKRVSSQPQHDNECTPVQSVSPIRYDLAPYTQNTIAPPQQATSFYSYPQTHVITESSVDVGNQSQVAVLANTEEFSYDPNLDFLADFPFDNQFAEESLTGVLENTLVADLGNECHPNRGFSTEEVIREEVEPLSAQTLFVQQINIQEQPAQYSCPYIAISNHENNFFKTNTQPKKKLTILMTPPPPADHSDDILNQSIALPREKNTPNLEFVRQPVTHPSSQVLVSSPIVQNSSNADQEKQNFNFYLARLSENTRNKIKKEIIEFQKIGDACRKTFNNLSLKTRILKSKFSCKISNRGEYRPTIKGYIKRITDLNNTKEFLSDNIKLDFGYINKYPDQEEGKSPKIYRLFLIFNELKKEVLLIKWDDETREMDNKIPLTAFSIVQQPFLFFNQNSPLISLQSSQAAPESTLPRNSN